MAKVTGSFQHESSADLDAFFAAVGVPWLLRKVMVKTNPRVDVSQDGDNYKILTHTLLKTMELSFQLDQPFDGSLMSGEKTQNVIRREGDSLIQEQSTPRGKIVITRTFNDTTMDMTLEHADTKTKATRHFRRIA